MADQLSLSARCVARAKSIHRSLMNALGGRDGTSVPSNNLPDANLIITPVTNEPNPSDRQPGRWWSARDRRAVSVRSSLNRMEWIGWVSEYYNRTLAEEQQMFPFRVRLVVKPPLISLVSGAAGRSSCLIEGDVRIHAPSIFGLLSFEGNG